MKKWEHILKYRPLFFVYTDASSLKYIVNLKSEETIFQHWYAELAQFEFIVIELRKLQESDEVWKEVLKWVSAGKTLKMQELRGSVQEVMSIRQIFNPSLFVIQIMEFYVNTGTLIQPSLIMHYMSVYLQ